MEWRTMKQLWICTIGLCLITLATPVVSAQSCSAVSNLQVVCNAEGTALVSFDLTNLTGVGVDIASFLETIPTSGGETIYLSPASVLFQPALPPDSTKRLEFQIEDAPPGESFQIQYILFHQDSAGIVSECCSSSIDVSIPLQCGSTPFIRGDVNGDSTINVADAITTLAYLFTGGTIPCDNAADSNDDGTLNIADAIALLGYLFSGTTPPPPPFPDCGIDPTVDALECESFDGF